MLSSGTRIGPYQVKSWIKEGSCGQSYKGEGGSGEEKGKIRYLKLFHRDLSEKEGFSDYFAQECRAIQQLDGRGIWPMITNGTLKWKHWMAYDWFEGKVEKVPVTDDTEEEREIGVITLADWMEYFPEVIGPTELEAILIDLHCGLNLAHSSGVIHGNIKPSNILIHRKEDGTFMAWITEFALAKISSFKPLGEDPNESTTFVSQSLQFQESLKESQKYRPGGVGLGDLSEEGWDLFALGGIVQFVLEKTKRPEQDWLLWQPWVQKALTETFKSIPQSMAALPGVKDLSEYGIKDENLNKESDLSNEEIRKKREIEWEKKQKFSSAVFRRNITGLIGCLCLIIFLFSKIYLFFNPSPWVEYSVDGASDKYQLGFGILSGKAWGILPASYDKDGEGGQDVAGEWSREDGMFRLNFRKFKQVNEEDSGKKLWQFIGKGATSDEDYFIWSDYLVYIGKQKTLKLIKRVQGDEIFVPGKRSKDNVTNLFPEMRIRRSGGLIKKTELLFKQTEGDGPSWSVFIGMGFLLASLLYHRILLGIPDKDLSLGKG